MESVGVAIRGLRSWQDRRSQFHSEQHSLLQSTPMPNNLAELRDLTLPNCEIKVLIDGGSKSDRLRGIIAGAKLEGDVSSARVPRIVTLSAIVAEPLAGFGSSSRLRAPHRFSKSSALRGAPLPYQVAGVPFAQSLVPCVLNGHAAPPGT